MLRNLRIVLMWLMALAVPIQGYAAAAMFGCGPGHHSAMSLMGIMATAPALHDPQEQLPGHDDSAEVGSGHSHADADDSAAADPVPGLEAPGTTSKATKGGCSPCASCCVVAALPTSAVTFQPVPPVDFFVPFAPHSVAVFLTEGLERPPRFILT